MLEVYLHKLNVLNPSIIIKREWFTSVRKAEEKLKFDFPDKEEILTLLHEIESKRNFLCYGKLQPLEVTESIIASFNKLKFLFEDVGLKWN